MNNINWKSVLIAALFIFAIPLLVNIILGMAYSVIIGFQSRNDMAIIEAASLQFSQSFLMRTAIWLGIAGAAFWRSRKMTTAVDNDVLIHCLLAAVVGMLLFSGSALGTQGSAGILLVVVGWVMALGGAYLGHSSDNTNTNRAVSG